MKTIFERYGGFAQVSRVVSSFYDAVLRSPRLAPYFVHTDMRALVDHQTKFVAHLMGGPASFSNEHLARTHAPHRISNADFDEALQLMREALEDHDYAPSDIETVITRLESHRPYIVAESSAAASS